MRAICIYIGYTKVTTSNQDIRPLVTVKVLLAIISGITKQIFTIKVMLESTHQMVSDNILYIIFIKIQVYQYSDIISYLLKLA